MRHRNMYHGLYKFCATLCTGSMKVKLHTMNDAEKNEKMTEHVTSSQRSAHGFLFHKPESVLTRPCSRYWPCLLPWSLVCFFKCFMHGLKYDINVKGVLAE